MTAEDGAARGAAPGSPVLFIVDADPQARVVAESALARRFGPDYRVLVAGTPQDALTALQHLAHHGGEVALVAADLRLPGMDGVEFLERAHALHPGCWRVLLVAMDRYHTSVPFTELAALQRATALGRIDFSVVKGWVTPEEWLYPQIQEALTAWTIAHRPSHVVYRIVGEQWAPRSHELRDLLTRNSVPFEFYAADSEAGQQLIKDFAIDVRRLPAVIHHDGSVQHDPSFADVAAAHGIETRPSTEVYDLAIAGAGPAGLGAAVYGASEGLRTVVFEPHAIGGQAGTSSMIRNYLGFPRGISGGGLAHRAWEQALLFGAQFVFMHEVVGLSARGDDRVIALGDGSQAVARAVIIATGVAYRRLSIPALDRLIGAGVFYGAAGVEAPAMAGEQVYVVGGANSAGQAALHLAKFAARVTVLVRGESLAAEHVRLPHHPTEGDPQHRCPAPHPGRRRPRPSPPGRPDARGRPDRPARTGPRRGRLRNDRRRAAHAMARRPRQGERSWIHPDRPRRSPGASAAPRPPTAHANSPPPSPGSTNSPHRTP